MTIRAGILVAALIIVPASAQEAPTFTGAEIVVELRAGELSIEEDGSSFKNGSGGSTSLAKKGCYIDGDAADRLYAGLARSTPVDEPIGGLGATWVVRFGRAGKASLVAVISRGSLLGHDPDDWAIFLGGKPAVLAVADRQAVEKELADAGCAPEDAEPLQ